MKKSSLTGYIFIAPWLIGLFVFTLYPMLYSLCISFAEWPLVGEPKFIGWKNYTDMFADKNFVQSLKVTGLYVLMSVPAQVFLSILVAVLLNQNIRGRGVFRTIFYLPAVVGGVATYTLWQFIFNPDFGLINSCLYMLGISPGPKWLQSTQLALPSLAIMSLWGLGSNMVIYLAGLQSIPKTYYEAASIDGAKAPRKFFSITLPLLTPTIFFNLIMTIIASFQTFTQAMVMTKGGPGNATLFYALYLYRNAFSYFKMGYASALAWFLFIIVVALNIVIFITSKRWVYYEGGEDR